MHVHCAISIFVVYQEVLNVYEEIRDGRLRYPMTLLAYAGYHDQTDMINYLISKGASKYSPPNSIFYCKLTYII